MNHGAVPNYKQKPKPTLKKHKAAVTPIKKKAYNLSLRSDFKECVKAVLGSDTPEAILELWTQALQSENKVLYQFLDQRLGNKVDDSNVVVEFKETKDAPECPK
jgi:ribosomal protein S20